MIFDVHGPERAPTLVLLGSLGTTNAMWDRQLPALTPWFRVVRVEHPGHGRAPAPPGPYTVEFLGQRVIEVMDEVGAGRPSVVGLSLGGIVAMWLAANQPDRVDRLVVCCTAPWLGPSEMWISRAGAVRADGLGPQLSPALSRWFTPPFLAEHPEVAEEISIMLSAVEPEGYAACCEALATNDLRADIVRIEASTLILSGAHDPVASPDVAASTMQAIPDASLTILAGAAHLANIEQAEAFNRAVVDHLVGAPGRRGLATRREVLGEAHVDASLGRATAFSRPWQDFLAGWPWGDVWARPGLDRSSRRLLTIGLLAGLGHAAEFEVHARAALRDGVDTEVLREVLLHTAVYAGVPAANSAFAIVERIIAEEGA